MKKRLLSRRILYGLLTALLLFSAVEASMYTLYGAPDLPLELALVGLARLEREADPGGRGAAGRVCLRHDWDARLDLCYPAKGPRRRVLVFGESSVRRGPGEGSENDFPVWLARGMPEVEVLNLGSPGQNSAGVAGLVAAAAPLEPDLVVLYLGHNDFAQVVFHGDVRTPWLWQVPALSLLAQSHTYAGLRAALLPDRGPRTDLHANSQLVPTADRTAIDRAPDILSRYEEALRAAVRDSPAPVLISTLIRNADKPPTGVYTPDAACAAMVDRLMQTGMNAEPAEVAAACGDSSVGAWIEARQALQRGQPEVAAGRFAASLRLDALPLRAPMESDDIIRQIAADTEIPAGRAGLIDLAPAFGPTPRNDFFIDILHPSVEGAQRVAATMIPPIRAALSTTQ